MGPIAPPIGAEDLDSTVAEETAVRTITVVAALIAAVAAGPPAHAAPAVPDVPATIAVQDGHKPYLLGHASGVQIYTCLTLPGGYAWSPATPRADLRDDSGVVIVRHFAGPSWQAKDGSLVRASRVDGVTVDPTAIQWLLLKAGTPTAGPDGDRLTATTYIQRINTTGGLTPPTTDCNPASAGSTREIPYTADYLFWKARSA